MALLELKNVSSGYGKKQVLFDITFAVERGEIALLIGSNGSGKSTVLKTIYGLLPVWDGVVDDAGLIKEKGSIYFDGEDITGLNASSLLKRGLVYVPQKDNIFSDLTVRENLEMAGLALNDRKLLKKRVDETLDAFATLVPLLDRIPLKLSGGERQLLAIGMAMIHRPRMIVVDEPFNGLGPHTISTLREKLLSFNKNEKVTFLIVEHRIIESYIMARTIISLKLGKVYGIENVDSHFHPHRLHEVFV